LPRVGFSVTPMALKRIPTAYCLVFGDVLEHMVDSWSVLARLARWVRDGDRVLTCIPNVQHYSVLVNLLRGKWEYQDEGLRELLARGYLVENRLLSRHFRTRYDWYRQMLERRLALEAELRDVLDVCVRVGIDEVRDDRAAW
jgi:hypothetical protein